MRGLGPEDWELFRRVRLAALAEAPSAFGSRYADWLDAEPSLWRSRLRDVPLNLVLIMDGEPVGLVSGTAPVDGTVELISLWVAPTARGRGVADEAVRLVRDWAPPKAPAGSCCRSRSPTKPPVGCMNAAACRR